MLEWLEAHGVTAAIGMAILGWSWSIDRRLSVLATDVAWLKRMGCGHCRVAESAEEQSEDT